MSSAVGLPRDGTFAMMVEAMGLLLNQLNAYIALADGGGPGAPNQALLGNIAQLDRPEIATELDNHLVLSSGEARGGANAQERQVVRQQWSERNRLPEPAAAPQPVPAVLG